MQYLKRRFIEVKKERPPPPLGNLSARPCLVPESCRPAVQQSLNLDKSFIFHPINVVLYCIKLKNN